MNQYDNKKHDDDLFDDKNTGIVVWGSRYVTGINLADKQHKELVDLANQLYRACLGGNEKAGIAFKDAMSRMVNYVRFHFSTEQQLLEKLRYPQYAEHKKLHDVLIRNILEAAKEYKDGKKFVPNHFVCTLKEWIFSHIAIEDKIYAAYIESKRKGEFSQTQKLTV